MCDVCAGRSELRNTHTRTHMRTHAHVRTCTHTRAQACTRTHRHTQTCAHVYTRTRAHIHTHAHTAGKGPDRAGRALSAGAPEASWAELVKVRRGGLQSGPPHAFPGVRLRPGCLPGLALSLLTGTSRPGRLRKPCTAWGGPGDGAWWLTHPQSTAATHRRLGEIISSFSSLHHVCIF